MFPDSMIAQKFKLGETKTKYYLDHGLKPHFLDLVWKKVDSNSVCKWFVICYDETLNDKLQAKQLDMYTRFWDGEHVVTRYIHSEFLGKATSVDIIECFDAIDDNGRLNKMLQVSMDGATVNLSAHKKLEELLYPYT